MKKFPSMKFRTLNQAAKLLKCDPNDFIQAGADGAIKIHILSSIFHIYINPERSKTHVEDPDADEVTDYTADWNDTPYDFEFIQLDKSCLKKLIAGQKNTPVQIAPQYYDHETCQQLFIGIYNGHNDIPGLDECELIIMADELKQIRKVQQSKAIERKVQHDELSETFKQEPVNNKKEPTYDRRARSFENYLADKHQIDPKNKNQMNEFFQVRNKNSIENELKSYDPDLWDFESFHRQFWSLYKKEKGLRLKSGRPKKVRYLRFGT